MTRRTGATLAWLALLLGLLHLAVRPAEHRIAVEARGDRFVLRIDGDEIARFESDRHRAGQAGLVASGNGTAVWDDIRVTGPDGAVLLASDFDVPPAAEWSSLRGDWRVTENGGYAAHSPGRSFALAGPPDWTDYTVEATLKPDGATTGDAGILVRGGPTRGIVCMVSFARNATSWFVREEGAWGPARAARRLRSPTGFRARKLARNVLVRARDAVGVVLCVVALAGALRLLLGQARTTARRETRPVLHALRPRWIAIVCALSFLSSAAVSALWLGGIPHAQDGVAYLLQAKIFASGEAHVPVHPLNAFFEHFFFLVHAGKVSSFYEPGWPAVLTPGVLLGAPWLVNPLLGAGTLYVVYRIGRSMYDAGTGLLAAALGAFSPFHVFLSASFLSHTACAFAIASFVYLWLRSRTSHSAFVPLLAGAALGLAGLTRAWTALAVLAPFAVVCLADLFGLLRANGWRRPAGARVRQYAWTAAGVAPLLYALLLYNQTITGSPLLFPRELVAPGISPLDNLLAGTFPDEGLDLANRRLSLLASHLFGWPLGGSLVLATVPFVVASRNAWDWLLLSAFASHFTAYAFYDQNGTCFGPRFIYESLPFLLLLSSRGAFEVARLCDGVGGRARGAVIVAVLLVMFATHALFAYVPRWLPLFPNYWGVSRDIVAAAEEAQLEDALVFMDPETVDPLSGFLANSPRLTGAVVFARSLGADDAKLAEHEAERKTFLYRDGALLRYDPERVR